MYRFIFIHLFTFQGQVLMLNELHNVAIENDDHVLQNATITGDLLSLSFGNSMSLFAH